MNSQPEMSIAAMLLALLAATGADRVIAAEDEHAAHHPAAEAMTTTDAATAPVGASSDAMANMKKMQEQMAAIRAATDPRERARLLDEHLRTMQATTKTMQGDKGCMMMGDGMAMKGSEAGGGMNMMQMMMEQMMQHQKAMQGSVE